MFDKILNIVWGIANAFVLDIQTVQEKDGETIQEISEKFERRALLSLSNGMFLDEQFVGKEIASHMATCNYFVAAGIFYTFVATTIVGTAITIAIIDEL